MVSPFWEKGKSSAVGFFSIKTLVILADVWWATSIATMFAWEFYSVSLISTLINFPRNAGWKMAGIPSFFGTPRYADMFSAFSELFQSFACFPSAKKKSSRKWNWCKFPQLFYTKTLWFKSEVFQNLPKHWEGRSRTAPIDRLRVFDPMSSRKTSGSKRKARMIWIMERKKLVNKKHQQKKNQKQVSDQNWHHFSRFPI